MYNNDLKREIEKILDENIKEVPYEGLVMDKSELIDDLMKFITNLLLNPKK